jgi:hypothetical protein
MGWNSTERGDEMGFTLAQIWSSISTETLELTRDEWAAALADGRAGEDEDWFAQHVADLSAEINRRAQA